MPKMTRRAKPRDGGKKPKKKTSILFQERVTYVDYKDVNLLQRFVSDRSKIRARRVSGNDVQQQREVANAIKVAREMGLLPYAKRVASTRTGGRREGRDGGCDGGREGRDGRRDEASTETADGAAVDSVDATGGELDSVSEEV